MNEPELKKAMDALEFLSQDEKLRMAYEARQKFLRDQASMMEAAKNAEIYGFKSGLEQGVRKGVEDTARRMLRKGMLPADVADATELPLERVQQLNAEDQQ